MDGWKRRGEDSHPEAICDDCGGPNITWFAPSEIWNKVVRNTEQTDPMLCPRCFAVRAEKQGFNATWSLSPDDSEIHRDTMSR